MDLDSLCAISLLCNWPSRDIADNISRMFQEVLELLVNRLVNCLISSNNVLECSRSLVNWLVILFQKITESSRNLSGSLMNLPESSRCFQSLLAYSRNLTQLLIDSLHVHQFALRFIVIALTILSRIHQCNPGSSLQTCNRVVHSILAAMPGPKRWMKSCAPNSLFQSIPSRRSSFYNVLQFVDPPIFNTVHCNCSTSQLDDHTSCPLHSSLSCPVTVTAAQLSNQIVRVAAVRQWKRQQSNTTLGPVQLCTPSAASTSSRGIVDWVHWCLDSRSVRCTVLDHCQRETSVDSHQNKWYKCSTRASVAH